MEQLKKIKYSYIFIFILYSISGFATLPSAAYFFGLPGYWFLSISILLIILKENRGGVLFGLIALSISIINFGMTCTIYFSLIYDHILISNAIFGVLMTTISYVILWVVNIIFFQHFEGIDDLERKKGLMCPSCGTKFGKNIKFCFACGEEIKVKELVI